MSGNKSLWKMRIIDRKHSLHIVPYQGIKCPDEIGNVALANTHRRSQGAMGRQICNISSHFVLWEAVSQKKYCYSPKIKQFGPPKILGWLHHCEHLVHSWKLVSRPIFASLGLEGFRSRLGLEGFRYRLGLEGFRSRDFEYYKEMVYQNCYNS